MSGVCLGIYWIRVVRGSDYSFGRDVTSRAGRDQFVLLGIFGIS
jgi:hypothetical protein